MEPDLTEVLLTLLVLFGAFAGVLLVLARHFSKEDSR